MSSRELSRRALLTGTVGAIGAGMMLGPFGVFISRQEQSLVVEHVAALGTRVSFLVRHPDPRHAQAAIERAMGLVLDVHATMTLHDESPLTHLNRRAAQGAVVVPSSLLSVLQAGMHVHGASGGVFDPTVSGVRNGMKQLELDVDNRSVRFHHPGLSLDLNGIAKGYAVDVAVQHLRESGIEHCIVNAGGDLYASGRPSDDQDGWPIHLGATGPSTREEARWVLSGRAVATSGNMLRPRDSAGIPIPHLIDPRTGLPNDQYETSTVLAESAMEADAWSTALFVGDAADMRARIEAFENLDSLCVVGSA
jgi:thiamine biosynthesis lipoprotein